jgi:hypothetical protein
VGAQVLQRQARMRARPAYQFPPNREQQVSVLKQYRVRSRETRVYSWLVVAASPEDAREWVEDQSGDTSASDEDCFDSTEVIDVTEVADAVLVEDRSEK